MNENMKCLKGKLYIHDIFLHTDVKYHYHIPQYSVLLKEENFNAQSSVPLMSLELIKCATL